MEEVGIIPLCGGGIKGGRVARKERIWKKINPQPLLCKKQKENSGISCHYGSADNIIFYSVLQNRSDN